MFAGSAYMFVSINSQVAVQCLVFIFALSIMYGVSISAAARGIKCKNVTILFRRDGMVFYKA